MKYLIGAICAVIVSLAFTGRKCEHKFTQVEQATVKIEWPDLYGRMVLSVYHRPSGIHEGKELVCVKCFHVQKQLLDYGPPDHGPTLTGLVTGIDSCLFISGGTLKIDTSGFIRAK